MIKALKALKSGSSSETDAKNKEKKTKSADEMFTLEITKLVNMIPSVEEVAPIPPVLQTEMTYISPLVRPVANHVPQPAGQFHCRMLQCDERLPICRMWNHIRTFHANHMVEQSAVGNEYTTHFTFPYNSYRRALHIRQFGLFFFIVNVEVIANSLKKITAWVQMVGRRDECRRFTYELNLHLGNRIATYKDAVSEFFYQHLKSFFIHCHEFLLFQTYGDWSDIDHIQSQAECLMMKTNQINTSRYPEIEVSLSITKLPTASYSARSAETRIEASPSDLRNNSHRIELKLIFLLISKQEVPNRVRNARN